MELLDIKPRELTFTVELRKQCTCIVQLGNKTDQYVAFKVKTTSPKRYCVRPNAGVVEPRGKCEFTVTMQAPRSAPTDLQCKDKFLVQGTVVPNGTSEESITSDMFSKDAGKYVEEKKLKVTLVSPSGPPTSVTGNSDVRQDTSHSSSREIDKAPRGVENLWSPRKDMDEFRSVDAIENSAFTADYTAADDNIIAKSVESRAAENGVEIKLPKEGLNRQEIEELKLKIDVLRLKLAEAEQTILKLTEEGSKVNREKDSVEQELALTRRHICAKTVYVGFPLLYVCMVALISVTSGYYMSRSSFQDKVLSTTSLSQCV
ncbi:hypothetical protein Dimus_001267 [Dionaea muscipula]